MKKNDIIIFNYNYILIMDYSNFELVINNHTKNIYGYKYKNIIDNDIKKNFTKCFNNWKGVSDEEILELKENVSKLTDNNINISGYTTKDSIVLINNINNDIHYYINFNKDDIYLWYISGTYQISFCNDNFDVLLMMLSI